MKHTGLLLFVCLMVGCSLNQEFYRRNAERVAASKARSDQYDKERHERRALTPIEYDPLKMRYEDYLAAKARVQSWFQSTLREPDSAQFDWGYWEDRWNRMAWKERRAAPLGSNGVFVYLPTEGWRLLVFVNAKNAFGGYAGTEPYHFLFEDDGRLSEVREWRDGSEPFGDARYEGPAAA